MANKNFDGMEQPSWYDGKMIDEVAFCASFLHQHPMKCVRNRLFTKQPRRMGCVSRILTSTTA